MGVGQYTRLKTEGGCGAAVGGGGPPLPMFHVDRGALLTVAVALGGYPVSIPVSATVLGLVATFMAVLSLLATMTRATAMTGKMPGATWLSYLSVRAT